MKVALIVIGSVLLFFGALIGACIWLASGPESGVKLSNQMDKYALDYLDQHHLLAPGEKVIAYFDETLKMDGTEAAILTSRRVLYHKDGRTTAILLSDVDGVQRSHEPLVGDIITVRSKAGESIRIEIAPLNGGDTFYDETMAAWKRAGNDLTKLPKDLVPSHAMTTLVIGGTGFLGEHLVRALAARGESVRVAVRGTYEPPRVDGDVQILHTDVIANPATRADGIPLAEAMAGCATVYHLAGAVSRDAGASQTMMRIHVDGTRRVLEAAKAAGVRRVVVASSSGTVAVSKTADPVPDESWPYATELVAKWPYYLSKIYQEKLALDLGRQLGLEIVIVNPSLLLGPGDRRQSSTGDVLRFLRRRIPAVPPGGVNFVDARDAAEATIAAMERGRPGERYLLGGPNWTVAEFFGRLERASKVRAPFLRLPSSISRGAASLMEQVYKKLDRDPPVDRVSVEMAELFWYCDSTKAKHELGFEPRDPAETLDATIRYLRTHARI